MIKIISRLLIMSMIISTGAFAFDGPAHYLHLGLSGGYANIKDMGTSPLRYHGIAGELELGYMRDERRSNSWGANGNMFYAAGIAASNYLMHHISGSFNAYYLHALPVFKDERMQFDAGGRLNVEMAATYNPSYQNASMNIDLFMGMYGKARLGFDFRRSAVERKIAFLYIRKPERNYTLNFQLDIPLLLINNRPEYPYVLNGVSTEYDLLAGHIYAGGFHCRTQLSLRRYLQNGNAMEIAYLWDAFTSGRKDLLYIDSCNGINFLLH